MMKSRTVRTTCACISRGHGLQSLYPKVKHDLYTCTILFAPPPGCSVSGTGGMVHQYGNLSQHADWAQGDYSPHLSA